MRSRCFVRVSNIVIIIVYLTFLLLPWSLLTFPSPGNQSKVFDI